MIATVVTKVLIVWVTASVTSPVNRCGNCAVMYHDTCNQIGTKYELTLAQVEWKGQVKEIELERHRITDEQLERSVACEERLRNLLGQGD